MKVLNVNYGKVILTAECLMRSFLNADNGFDTRQNINHSLGCDLLNLIVFCAGQVRENV